MTSSKKRKRKSAIKQCPLHCKYDSKPSLLHVDARPDALRLRGGDVRQRRREPTRAWRHYIALPRRANWQFTNSTAGRLCEPRPGRDCARGGSVRCGAERRARLDALRSLVCARRHAVVAAPALLAEQGAPLRIARRAAGGIARGLLHARGGGAGALEMRRVNDAAAAQRAPRSAYSLARERGGRRRNFHRTSHSSRYRAPPPPR